MRYCTYCNKEVSTIEGYHGNKCVTCYQYVKPDNFFSKIITLVVFLFIANFIFMGLASALPVDINGFSSNPANGSTVNKYVFNQYNITTANNIDTVINSFNNTNYSFYDNTLLVYLNLNNYSSLNENDTFISDISKYNNNMTIFGYPNTTMISNGKYNGAINFTGRTAYLKNATPLVDLTNNATSLTMSAWIKLASDGYDTSSSQPIITTKFFYTQIRGNNFLIRGGNVSQAFTSGSSLTISNRNNWHLVTATYNFNGSTSNLTSYVDGQFWQSSIYFGGITTIQSQNGNSLEIGRISGGNFNGSIDEVMIWNRTLTAQEVSNLYTLSFTKYNQTNYAFTINQSLYGISNLQTGIFLNDTSSNFNLTNSYNRNLYNLIFGTNSIGIVRGDMYGVNTHGLYFNNYTLLINRSGNLQDVTNFTYHQQMFRDSKMNTIRADMNLQTISNADGTFNNQVPSDSNNTFRHLNNMIYASQNNITVTYIAGFMPLWLANVTSACSSNNKTCPPTNYSAWGDLVVRFIDNITDNGRYNSSLQIEVWNEPDLDDSLLANVSENITGAYTRASVYVLIYNATYNAIKSKYPNMPIGGGGFAAENIRGTALMQTFYSNMSNKTDFLVAHRYEEEGEEISNVITTRLLNIISNKTFYNVNTNKIYLNEWNIYNATVMNNSGYNYVNFYAMSLAKGYNTVLNLFNTNVTMQFYQWSEQTFYNNTASYYGFPRRFSMLSEPQLDNAVYPAYFITANYTRYAKGTIYNSTVDNSEVQSVASKYSNACNIILTNTINDYQNVSVSWDTTLCGTQMIDTQTGSILNNGSTVIQSAYGVNYITTPYQSLINSIWYYTNYLGEAIRGLTQGESPSMIVNYTYTYSSNGGNNYSTGTLWLITYSVSMIVNFFSLMPVIGTILAIVLIVSVLVILVVFVKRMADNKPNIQGFQG